MEGEGPLGAASGSAMPSAVQSWYHVCRSAVVQRGEVITRELPGRSVALFRGRTGAVHALSAHCSHMGAHLGRGKVLGDHLQCPLHHWEYDGRGFCRNIPGAASIPERARQLSYPITERYGGVFLFNGAEPLFPAPSFSAASEADLGIAHGRPVELQCAWPAVAANGFDVRHLQTVHERALHDPPLLERLDRYRIRLRYISRVTGNTAADRVMRRLSRNRIAVTVTCWGGTTVTIESDIGIARGKLMLALQPMDGSTRVTPIFAVSRTGIGLLDALRTVMARGLFAAFLQRDVAIMDGMRFDPRLTLPEDEVLGQFLQYLRALPVADTDQETMVLTHRPC